nr:DUF167 domain-containing protein [Massilia sp. TS11]
MAVQIQPNAKKTEVVGEQGDALKLKLHAAPIEGKANEALVRYLAETLKLARSRITITHGLTNKRKLIEIDGVTPADVIAALCPQ